MTTTWGGSENNEIEEYVDWLIQPDGKQPRHYVTRISVPRLGGNGIQRLHSPMKEPGPEPQAGA